MLAVPVRTLTGSEAGTVELAADVFGIEPNEAVMHQVVTAQLAARRTGSHKTKTRSEVSGVAASRGARRARVEPGTAPFAPRSGGAEESPTAPDRAATPRPPPRR